MQVWIDLDIEKLVKEPYKMIKPSSHQRVGNIFCLLTSDHFLTLEDFFNFLTFPPVTDAHQDILGQVGESVPFPLRNPSCRHHSQRPQVTPGSAGIAQLVGIHYRRNWEKLLTLLYIQQKAAVKIPSALINHCKGSPSTNPASSSAAFPLPLLHLVHFHSVANTLLHIEEGWES